MSYQKAHEHMHAYHVQHTKGLTKCELHDSWFTSVWDMISDMLKPFDTDDENKAISGSYRSGVSHKKRTKLHFKHDYVCGLRREVRKQYVSGDDDVYTDITPFRYGVTSANGAKLFSSVMDQIIGSKSGGET